MLKYSNNGMTALGCEKDYIAQEGEVVFEDVASAEELAAAFSGYESAMTLENGKVISLQAQSLLSKSDVIVIRAAESGSGIPADWIAYRAALRAIVSSGSGVLPTAPSSPTT